MFSLVSFFISKLKDGVFRSLQPQISFHSYLSFTVGIMTTRCRRRLSSLILPILSNNFKGFHTSQTKPALY